MAARPRRHRDQPVRAAAIGQGIAAALNAIDIAEHGPPNGYYTNGNPAPTTAPEPVPPGSHSSAVILLLTDGENNEQPDPLAVSLDAAVRGIKINTVGLGSPGGTVLQIDGFQVATSLDEAMLREIASTTDGRYFAAADEKALADVYDSIDLDWVVESDRREVTALFAASAVLLLLLGAGLSLAWFGRAV